MFLSIFFFSYYRNNKDFKKELAKKRKTKFENMVANDIKIFLRMKNKGWFSIVKNKDRFIIFIFKNS